MNCDVPALWSEYKDRLYSFIIKRVKDSEDVKDLHQIILMKVYGFCQSKSGVKNVNAWLYQIARNTISDYYKERAKYTDLEKFDAPEVEDISEMQQEANSYLLPLINLLPKEYGEPLRLSDIEDLKQKDVAEKLNLSLSATKSRIQRAREMLKKELLQCCIIEFGDQGEVVEFEIRNHCKPLMEEKLSRENK